MGYLQQKLLKLQQFAKILSHPSLCVKGLRNFGNFGFSFSTLLPTCPYVASRVEYMCKISA
jgi:hypothetical protein